MNDIFQSGYHEPPLGYDDVEWLVDAITRLGKKINFYFENTNEYIIMTKEDGEH